MKEVKACDPRKSGGQPPPQAVAGNLRLNDRRVESRAAVELHVGDFARAAFDLSPLQVSAATLAQLFAPQRHQVVLHNRQATAS